MATPSKGGLPVCVGVGVVRRSISGIDLIFVCVVEEEERRNALSLSAENFKGVRVDVSVVPQSKQQQEITDKRWVHKVCSWY